MNFLHPTPIQAATIPIALMGRDIYGCAATGTGNTLSCFVFCPLSFVFSNTVRCEIFLCIFFSIISDDYNCKYNYDSLYMCNYNSLCWQFMI